MVRTALAVLFLLHGIAHLVGFAVPWRLLETPEMPYKTTLLAGRVDVGVLGIRVVGVVWLLLALAFAAAAVGALTRQEWWPGLAVVVTLVSMGMSLLSIPEARIGIVVNLGILVLLFAGARLAWW